MENFNFKQYLSEKKLLKEEINPTQYPEEILAMDKEIEELKAKLQAAITAKNKAKSSFTKTVPALFGQPGEYEGIRQTSKPKQFQYQFRDFVEWLKKWQKENGNDWESLKDALKVKFNDFIRVNNTNTVMGRMDFFNIHKSIPAGYEPENLIKIGMFYVEPN